MSDLKNIPCFLCTFTICYLWNSSRQTPLKILNKALALASLPLLSALSHSFLGLSSLVDLPWALRINGGPQPYSTKFYTNRLADWGKTSFMLSIENIYSYQNRVDYSKKHHFFTIPYRIKRVNKSLIFILYD